MTALIEIIFDGLKKFGGEIIAAVLLAIAFAVFPSLRKLFRKKIIQKRKSENSLNSSGRKNNSSPASKKLSSVMTQSCKIFRLKQKKKKNRKPIYRSR